MWIRYQATRSMAGNVQVWPGVADGWCGVDKHIPPGRDEVDLLAQFAGSGIAGRFASYVEQPGGQLPEVGTAGVAVLANHREVIDPVDLPQGQDENRAGVIDVVPGDDLTRPQVDPIAAHVEDQPAPIPAWNRAGPDCASR